MPFILISTDPTRRREIAALLRTTGQEVIEVADRPSIADRVGEQDGVLVVDLDAPGLFAPLLEDLRQPSGSRVDWSLEAMERRHIRAMLEHTGGNRREAAHLLGIARSTLLAKLRRYDLDRPSPTETA
jgi:transcriptional regulator with PAS, ATPase and Fis domain